MRIDRASYVGSFARDEEYVSMHGGKSFVDLIMNETNARFG